MPESFPPVRPYPGKHRTMIDAAASNQIVTLRCNGCRRTVNYLATDLIEVVGPHHHLQIPPFDCSRCGTTEYVEVKVRCPTQEEVGLITVRRPAGKRQLWRNEVLGEQKRRQIF